MLHLAPARYNDPSMTAITRESVRFASCLVIDSYGAVVNDWHTSLLKPVRLYRRYRPAALIMSLLLASGNEKSRPYLSASLIKPCKE